MLAIKNEDFEIIQFLDEFKIATTKTIHSKFMSDKTLRWCQMKLEQLTKDKEIRRKRKHICDQYLYYLKFPKQWKHSLLLTEFYGKLNQLVNVIGFKPEFSIGSIRSDGLVAYKYNNSINKSVVAFVEIQTRHEEVDINKYERLYYSEIWKEKFDTFPKIIAVTNRKVRESEVEEIDVVKIDLDLNNIDKILEG